MEEKVQLKKTKEFWLGWRVQTTKVVQRFQYF